MIDRVLTFLLLCFALVLLCTANAEFWWGLAGFLVAAIIPIATLCWFVFQLSPWWYDLLCLGDIPIISVFGVLVYLAWLFLVGHVYLALFGTPPDAVCVGRACRL